MKAASREQSKACTHLLFMVQHPALDTCTGWRVLTAQAASWLLVQRVGAKGSSKTTLRWLTRGVATESNAQGSGHDIPDSGEPPVGLRCALCALY